MSEPANNSIEYFLGIEGEQKGPFSKDEIFTMLKNGEISEETPLWCSGMADWSSISNSALFNKEELSLEGTLSQISIVNETSKPKSKIPLKASLSQIEFSSEQEEPQSPNEYKTVFSEAANFKVPSSNNKITNQLLIGIGVLVAAGVVFWMQTQNEKQPIVLKQVEKLSPAQSRSLNLSKLQVQFNKDSSNVIPAMLQMIKDNPADNAGLEALETLLSHYRRQQMFSEAGTVLMAAKKPLEALDYFLKDPPDYAQAEKAYEQAASQAKGNNKREFLIKQIDLLIRRLGNTDKAISQIKVLDREFPGVQHPYQYYLKSTEQRIADIFSRISFHYSETINNYISGELAQLQFEGNPLLQIIKNRDDRYRIIATYKGPINLRNDRLPNVFFVFWLVNEQWFIVDTNLTKERARFAKEEQKKHESTVVTASEMLQGLETLFKTQFPGKGLHELVIPPKRQAIGTVE